MIKTIFFDLGNVLVDFDWKASAIKIADHAARSPEEVYHLCSGSEIARKYECGMITTAFFFETLKDEIGFKLTAEELHGLWSDIFTLNEKNVAVLDKIRKIYPVGLISNTNEAHVHWIEKQFGFLAWFPHPTYSYFEGCMKPRKEIFLSALTALSVTAKESLFIDDLDSNVLAARELGMQAIHLSPEKDLELELKKFDVKVI
ncbi:HAD family phosphatase [bacterium]|nr:HAD family phosphatase [bacterium]